MFKSLLNNTIVRLSRKSSFGAISKPRNIWEEMFLSIAATGVKSTGFETDRTCVGLCTWYNKDANP